jgi:hypothetical protein
MSLVQGCAAVSVISLAADSLSYKAQERFMQTIEEEHKTWHDEK